MYGGKLRTEEKQAQVIKLVHVRREAQSTPA